MTSERIRLTAAEMNELTTLAFRMANDHKGMSHAEHLRYMELRAKDKARG